MAHKLTDCYTVSVDEKRDAYDKKSEVSNAREYRVKIKNVVVKDCKQVPITNENQEEDDEREVLVDEEEKQEDEEQSQDEVEPSMEKLMENFRRFAKNQNP